MDRQYVFLSYSHDDQAIADIVLKKLQDAGIPCWVDHEKIRGGQNYIAAIDPAVEDCAVFLPLLSKSYVDKNYCEHEFNLAVGMQKCIMPVCIDDVSKKTNRKHSYMFTFYAGYDILRFGTGVRNTEEDINALCDSILQSVPIQQLLRINQGDPYAILPIRPSDYLLAHLRRYHKGQYQQIGNYALSELCAALFPAIKDVDMNINYKDEQNQSVSLVKYLTDAQAGKWHIFLTGEGGMGKTVSLLKTCEYLLDQEVCAIYIPLKDLGGELTLDKYLKHYVCAGKEKMYEHLTQMMSHNTEDASVVFLLDGVNEIASGDFAQKLFQDEIVKRFIRMKQSAQFIATSRFDARDTYGLTDSFKLLEMQPLGEKTVTGYLAQCGICIENNPTIKSILKTPLLLTLYANVEQHRQKYEAIDGITLCPDPDTAGKILGNFFQTQLFRAVKETTFVQAEQLVLLEHFLPVVAYHMVCSKCFHIKKSDIWEYIDQIKANVPSFLWCRDDRLRIILEEWDGFNADKLLALAKNALHFLHLTDKGYEFLHPTFRDYFAAYYIANEMRAFLKKPERMDTVEPLLESTVFHDDILTFVSDITHEEEARPDITEEGCVFPGKTSQLPSNRSISEQLLPLWRNRSGVGPQNAVCNLIQIMRIGRKNILAWCDFSELDLRGCRMNGARFTEWYCDQLYPSRFDGAWMDREFFLTNGHDAAVTAVETDGGSLVFSGDKHGLVKVLDRSEKRWIKELQLYSGPVVHLAWDSCRRELAVLYEHILFVYALDQDKVTFTLGNDSRNQLFRYVAFDETHHILISYNTEPLLWYTANGAQFPSPLGYDVPVGSAQWNPCRDMIVRGYLQQKLSVDVFDRQTNRWQQHPSLIAQRDSIYAHKKDKYKYKVFIDLRQYGASKSRNVSSIYFHPGGQTFLVAIGSLVLEFDSHTLHLLQKVTLSGEINSVCYGKDCVVVGTANHIVVLNADFTETLFMWGTQTQTVVAITENPSGAGYYLIDSDSNIKLLDQTLCVQRCRRSKVKKHFTWARDRKTGRIQMMFLPTPTFPDGSVFSFETGSLKPTGWYYEPLDILGENTNGPKIYRFTTSVAAISSTPPYDKFTFTNYGGILIYGCSFLRIKGDMQLPQNQKLLKQYGGSI